jgi:hypothetical protein
METLKTKFISNADYVLKDNEALSSESISIKEMFTKSIVNAHNEKVRSHFETLSELDIEYGKFLNTKGTINDLLVANAKVQILSLARSMFVGSIKNYESSLTEFKGQVQFRLNVTIAIFAIVVSMIGIGV